MLKYWIRSLEDSSSYLSHLTGRLPFIADFVLNRLDGLFYRHITWFWLICIFSSHKTMLLKAAVRRKYEKHYNKKHREEMRTEIDDDGLCPLLLNEWQ